MTELRPSLKKTKRLILQLQKKNSEATNIDAKGTLNLNTPGDRAFFIRHVAALANCGGEGFLLIGIEDKTWVPIGIPDNSPLQSVDVTQQQMNQALANRLDPRLIVCYITHKINNLVIGVVGIDGINSPYIVSIEKPKYGGLKTKGDESYVFKGAVYTRQGTESVVVDRQRDLIAILSGKIDRVETFTTMISIAAIVSVGVGFGAGLIKFADPYIAAILGGIWGSLIGLVFSKRLADTLGKFSEGVFRRVVKNAIGPAWGVMIGSFLSYIIINGNLTGNLKILDPVSMGFMVAPMLTGILLLIILAINLLMSLVFNIALKDRN